MIIGVALKNEKDVLKRHSIYYQRDDSDRDYEFFVLVDPPDPRDRSPFLQELYHALIIAPKPDSNLPSFALEETRDAFAKLIEEQGISEKTGLLNSESWLKLQVEEYPTRLFVAIDKSNWQDESGKTPFDPKFWRTQESDQRKNQKSSASKTTLQPDIKVGSSFLELSIELDNWQTKWKRSPFLFKRICWLDINELECTINNTLSNSANSKPEEQAEFPNNSATDDIFPVDTDLKIWLYTKWISHVAKRIRGIQDKYLYVHFWELDIPTKEEPYFPASLPVALRAGREVDFSESGFSIDLKRHEILFKKELESSFVVYRRHDNVFFLNKSQKWKTDYSDAKRTVFGEDISGVLSYFSRLIDGARRLNDASSLYCVLGLVESALLRVGIFDERVQEWFANLLPESAGKIYQQRILCGYIDGPRLYAQKDKPEHGYYSVLKIPGETDGQQEKAICKITTYSPGESNFREVYQGDPTGCWFDIGIVHQGILDKWEPQQQLTRTIFSLKDIFPFLFITSGRGVPTNLPKGVKFLPYSGLESCLISGRFEKFTLVKQLFSI